MVSQAPRNWLSSPLGVNTLLYLCGNKGPVLEKYAQINSNLKTSNAVTIKNSVFVSGKDMGKIPKVSDTEVKQTDFERSDLKNVIFSWVNQHEGSANIDKQFPTKITGLFVNVSTIKDNWKSIKDGKAPVMKIYNSFNYTQDVKYEARLLELPLRDDDLRLVIVVPNEKDTLPGLVTALTEKGLEEAVKSIEPLFTACSVLAAPKIKFSSEMTTTIDKCTTAIQHGDIDINEYGVSAKVLTCLFTHSKEFNISFDKEEQAVTSFFFAVTYKGTALYTGHFKP